MKKNEQTETISAAVHCTNNVPPKKARILATTEPIANAIKKNSPGVPTSANNNANAIKIQMYPALPIGRFGVNNVFKSVIIMILLILKTTLQLQHHTNREHRISEFGLEPN